MRKPGEAFHGESEEEYTAFLRGETGPRAVHFPIKVVETKDVAWLWPGKLPIGKLSLVVGDPGMGKSLLMLDLAARLSTKQEWPDKQENSWPESATLLITAEDDIADTVRPRFEAAGGNAELCHTLKGLMHDGVFLRFVMPSDLGHLRLLLAKLREVRLVVIDPLLAFIRGGGSGGNSALRVVAATLQDIAREMKVAVVGVSHLSKAPSASLVQRVAGGAALVGAARAVWCLWPHPEEPKRTLFVPLKCNLSASGNAYAYRIVESDVMGKVPVVLWEAEPAELALAPTGAGGPAASPAVLECAAWVRRFLGDGPRPAAEMVKAAKADGFSASVVKKARRLLGVAADHYGVGDAWTVRLPE
ncbi:MAG: AAA family ATPase [Planctomycetes bacterium]|nr:AAA family ATPase [Planctomycetota bacterium]